MNSRQCINVLIKGHLYSYILFTKMSTPLHLPCMKIALMVTCNACLLNDYKSDYIQVVHWLIYRKMSRGMTLMDTHNHIGHSTKYTVTGYIHYIREKRNSNRLFYVTQ